MNLEARMHQSITRRSSNIILRSELAHLGSETQVSHVIQRLIAKGELTRISRGVFLNTRVDKALRAVSSHEKLKAVIKELLEKFNLTPHGGSPSISEDSAETNFLIEVENPRINKTLSFYGRKVQFISYKPRKSLNKSIQYQSFSPSSVASQVREMASQYGLSYTDNPMDNWAKSVTRLAGDDVKSDPIKDLIIVLKRAGKISKKEVANLMAGYIKERRHGV